jgi:hypothetical protein
MPKETTITQHADIKVLMPILQEALKGSEGALNLNMVGPIYITTANKGESQELLPAPIPKMKYKEISSDDIFSEELSLREFQRKAEDIYFRIVCSRHDFQKKKLKEVLQISSTWLLVMAKRCNVKLASKGSDGGFIS